MLSFSPFLITPKYLQARPLTIIRPPRLRSLQSVHKSLHKQQSKPTSILRTLQDLTSPTPLRANPETGTHDPWPGFKYSGSLRPYYPLSPTRKVPPHIQRPDYHADGIPLSEQRAKRNKITVLDAKGIEGMRKVCRLAREVLDTAAAAVKPGVTTDQIDEVVHNACIERDVRFLPPYTYLPNTKLLRVQRKLQN